MLFKWWGGLSIAARGLLALGLLVVAVLAVWAGYRALTANPRAEARLARNQAEAASQSGADAVNTVAEAGDREHDLDKGTDDAGRKIDSATDAAGADAAGSERLCRLSADLCRK